MPQKKKSPKPSVKVTDLAATKKAKDVQGGLRLKETIEITKKR